MIRIQTPSRLHFGLFRVLTPASPDGPPTWRFGSVGLMVEKPGLVLAAQRAESWRAEGPLANRTLAFARQFAQTLPANSFVPLHFRIEKAPPEHAGLGTGTQLGLAVARALMISSGRPHADIADLAPRVGRGGRSTVGMYGFDRGGFLIDTGHQTHEDRAQPPIRFSFPQEWPLVLVTPRRQRGLHGAAERQAFQDLQGLTAEQTDALWRLLRLDLLPALAARDLETFSEALHEFNKRIGETFATAQGGTYATHEGAELVAFVRRRGIRGVGQSSWGPTIFALLEDERSAHNLVDILRRQFALEELEVVVTRACNRGAIVID
jgi:beta-ribofuranosylaminobenzene 5'-phosphate synthase